MAVILPAERFSVSPLPDLRSSSLHSRVCCFLFSSLPTSPFLRREAIPKIQQSGGVGLLSCCYAIRKGKRPPDDAEDEQSDNDSMDDDDDYDDEFDYVGDYDLDEDNGHNAWKKQSRKPTRKGRGKDSALSTDRDTPRGSDHDQDLRQHASKRQSGRLESSGKVGKQKRTAVDQLEASRESDLDSRIRETSKVKVQKSKVGVRSRSSKSKGGKAMSISDAQVTATKTGRRKPRMGVDVVKMENNLELDDDEELESIGFVASKRRMLDAYKDDDDDKDNDEDDDIYDYNDDKFNYASDYDLDEDDNDNARKKQLRKPARKGHGKEASFLTYGNTPLGCDHDQDVIQYASNGQPKRHASSGKVGKPKRTVVDQLVADEEPDLDSHVSEKSKAGVQKSKVGVRSRNSKSHDGKAMPISDVQVTVRKTGGRKSRVGVDVVKMENNLELNNDVEPEFIGFVASEKRMLDVNKYADDNEDQNEGDMDEDDNRDDDEFKYVSDYDLEEDDNALKKQSRKTTRKSRGKEVALSTNGDISRSDDRDQDAGQHASKRQSGQHASFGEVGKQKRTIAGQLEVGGESDLDSYIREKSKVKVQKIKVRVQPGSSRSRDGKAMLISDAQTTMRKTRRRQTRVGIDEVKTKNNLELNDDAEPESIGFVASEWRMLDVDKDDYDNEDNDEGDMDKDDNGDDDEFNYASDYDLDEDNDNAQKKQSKKHVRKGHINEVALSIDEDTSHGGDRDQDVGRHALKKQSRRRASSGKVGKQKRIVMDQLEADKESDLDSHDREKSKVGVQSRSSKSSGGKAMSISNVQVTTRKIGRRKARVGVNEVKTKNNLELSDDDEPKSIRRMLDADKDDDADEGNMDEDENGDDDEFNYVSDYDFDEDNGNAQKKQSKAPVRKGHQKEATILTYEDTSRSSGRDQDVGQHASKQQSRRRASSGKVEKRKQTVVDQLEANKELNLDSRIREKSKVRVQSRSSKSTAGKAMPTSDVQVTVRKTGRRKARVGFNEVKMDNSSELNDDEEPKSIGFVSSERRKLDTDKDDDDDEDNDEGDMYEDDDNVSKTPLFKGDPPSRSRHTSHSLDADIRSRYRLPGLVCCFGAAHYAFIPSGRPANRYMNHMIQNSMRYWGPDKFVRAPGGSSSSVAIALARLGGRVAFMGKLGNDLYGRRIRLHLYINEVQTRAVRMDTRRHTAVSYMKILQKGGLRLIPVRSCPEDSLTSSEINIAVLKKAKIFYFNSSSLIDPSMRATTMHAIETSRKFGGVIFYDLNLPLSLWQSRDDTTTLIQESWNLADVIEVTKQELEFICGIEPTETFDTNDNDISQFKHYGSEVIMPLWHEKLKVLFVTNGTSKIHYYTKNFNGWVQGREDPPSTPHTADMSASGDSIVAGLLRKMSVELELLTNERYLKKMIKYAISSGIYDQWIASRVHGFPSKESRLMGKITEGESRPYARP